MASSRVVFRIIYGTLYFVLCFVLLGLLLISPGDAIYQAKLIGQPYNIWIIIIAYASTIALVLFIYALRLYITKTVLASIPKAWIPVDRGDVPKHVYKMIWAGLGRSAAIAYEARPRLEPVPLPLPMPLSVSPPSAAVVHGEKTREENDEKPQPPPPPPRKGLQRLRLTKTATGQDEQHRIVVMPPQKPVWGDIEHYGWASPTSPDLPNLQYGTVLAELPNLIEAKAVGLAPPEPPSPSLSPSSPEQQPPLLDPEAVALLQRAPSMDLREYLSHLAELGVLPPGNAAASGFLGLYEHARYSTRPISNARFREMMHLFAELLRSMQPLDPAVLERLQVYDEEEEDEEEEEEEEEEEDEPDEDGGDDDGEASKPSADIDDDAPRSHISRSRSPASGSRASPKLRPPMSARNSSANTWAYRTAPTTPRTGGRVASLAAAGRRETSSPASSVDSFAQTRRPYPVSRASSASLRSEGTGTASGSVIRLARDEEDGDMPYVLTLTDTI